MTTLKEFEDALREQGMHLSLAILEKLRERDRTKRSVSPARRVTGRKMTPDLAHRILELHQTTKMTQQEIAFQLGVNQGRVNEVIKRGKWLTDDPGSPEAIARDQAIERIGRGAAKTPRAGRAGDQVLPPRNRQGARVGKKPPGRRGEGAQAQLVLGDL